MKITHKKVGLALGSGAIRGFALIGVLQALKEHEIPIDLISGASSGAIVAAHYAVFQDANLLKEELLLSAKKNKLPSVFDLGLRGGLIKAEKVSNFLKQLFAKKTFLDTKIPLRIVTTDLVDGRPTFFSEGKLAFCVQASCAVPVIFEPIKYQGHCFVDGGLSDPVPVNILKKMGADVVIAVNLYHKNEFINRRFTLPKVAFRSSRIAIYNLAQASIKDAEVVISPDLSPFVTVSLKKHTNKKSFDEMIELGYRATLKQIPKIKELLK